jgi:hypothetical protein
LGASAGFEAFQGVGDDFEIGVTGPHARG